MRYMARRITTGEWIDRDLPLSQVERTRNLSGPGLITATISPELRNAWHTDGLRVLDEWATMIYAADDNGPIRNAGIFVDAQYDEGSLVANCPGFATYPQGYIYDTARNWGPTSTGKTKRGEVIPDKPRPDPLAIVVDHWAWIQGQPDSNLGVRLVGDTSSKARIGSYEEPYRLRWWEVPDLGKEIDTLASETPFDYVEEVEWSNDAQTQVEHRIRLGWPRLGRPREDLRFVLGENIAATVPAATTGGAFANDVLGIGLGEGSKMVTARATKRDGRLRRTRVITDKTAKQGRMNRLTSSLVERSSDTLNITEVLISEHPNAPIGSIGLGDDVLIQTYLPSYGDVEMWVRVLSITEDETGDTAVLGTSRSNAFIYNSDVEVSA